MRLSYIICLFVAALTCVASPLNIGTQATSAKQRPRAFLSSRSHIPVAHPGRTKASGVIKQRNNRCVAESVPRMSMTARVMGGFA